MNIKKHTIIFKYIFKCNEVYYAGYNIRWYSMEPKITKNLLIFLIRGTKPVYLTAGKIFPITMATFCGVKFNILLLF
jgi:hypothetical protein